MRAGFGLSQGFGFANAPPLPDESVVGEVAAEATTLAPARACTPKLLACASEADPRRLERGLSETDCGAESPKARVKARPRTQLLCKGSRRKPPSRKQAAGHKRAPRCQTAGKSIPRCSALILHRMPVSSRGPRSGGRRDKAPAVSRSSPCGLGGQSEGNLMAIFLNCSRDTGDQDCTIA
jgi:hypothetical protein